MITYQHIKDYLCEATVLFEQLDKLRGVIMNANQLTEELLQTSDGLKDKHIDLSHMVIKSEKISGIIRREVNDLDEEAKISFNKDQAWIVDDVGTAGTEHQ